MKKPIIKRFEEKHIPVTESGCWLWTDFIGKARYGSISYKGKKIKAHRLAYELFVGPIPKGEYVCHKCDIPSCVNPSHLFIGSQQDNMDDMNIKGRSNNVAGENVGTAKLKESDVIEIRSSKATQRVIAKKYGISRAAVYYIQKKIWWKHVPWPSEETMSEDQR